MTPVGLRHLILSMLPFMSVETLKEVIGDVEQAMLIVRFSEKPWEKEGLTPEEVLSYEEKVVLMGIPCKSNPFSGKAKDGATHPHKIHAIKNIRTRLSYGLKQSKWLMDEYEEGVRKGKYSLPEVPEEDRIPEVSDMMQNLPGVLS
jgi:ribosomal protein L7/L12